MKPLLSIMLPTYNRCKKLERGLELLSKMHRGAIASPMIDFCIIDNASTDYTEDTITRYETQLPIRRMRNDFNIGGHNNILKCVVEARGEYTWIVGDDDIILPGAICSILRALKENPDVDFLGVPLGLIDEAQLDALMRRPSLSADQLLAVVQHETRGLPGFLEWAGSRQYRIEWQDLIDPDFNSVYLGAVMASLFRTSLCVETAKSSFIDTRRPIYDSLENSYPHAVLFANCFSRSRTMVLPHIALAAIIWERGWSPYRALFITHILHNLLDYYGKVGVSAQKIDKCRRALLREYRGNFWEIVFKRDPLYRKDFSLLRQFRKYSRYREFWLAIVPGRRNIFSRIARKIIRSL